MTRDQTIAHLVLHGWEAVREIPSAITGYGIFNPRFGYGYRVAALGMPRQHVRGIDAHRYVLCDWSDISDTVLELVTAAHEARLKELWA